MNPRVKKIIAEAFAGLIPGEMERNRWRGLLRYGPWRVLKLYLSSKRHKTAPEHYLTICAIAKNEGAYFREWIEWHKAQGVSKFYIYDNESTDDTAQILAPYIAQGLVEYTYRQGRRQQIPVYDDCIARHRAEARWLIFLDLDEFIVPVNDATVVDFLRRMESHPVVEVNWLVYGSGGENEKSAGTVMERFRRHSRPEADVNRHVKSFIDPLRVCNMVGCHEAARLPGTGKAVDVNGAPILRNWRKRHPALGDIRINHYAVKSYAEFLGKQTRGRARTLKMRDNDYFDRYDLNDIDENNGASS